MEPILEVEWKDLEVEDGRTRDALESRVAATKEISCQCSVHSYHHPRSNG